MVIFPRILGVKYSILSYLPFPSEGFFCPASWVRKNPGPCPIRQNLGPGTQNRVLGKSNLNYLFMDSKLSLVELQFELFVYGL